MVNGKNHEFTEAYKHSKVNFSIRLTRCVLLVLSISVSQVFSVCAQTVAVGLMDHSSITSLLFSPSASKYVLMNDKSDTLYVFKTDDAISMTVLGERLLVKSPYGLNDTVASLKIVGEGNSPNFRVRFNNENRDHSYFDDLMVMVKNGNLTVVNQVGIEPYVARVVQAEVGYGANEEYYKIQSIICRTYAVRNLERHASDGFDLCDSEHCQVYSGLKTATNEVMKATSATSGLVMVDPKNEFILSAFHANCGGQTANSEDVWKESRSYLTSVTDTFCTQSRSATWDKSMPLEELIAQLGFEATAVDSSGWSFLQPEREKFFTLNQDSIEMSKMRRLLQLRSTNFDLKVENGKAEFTGRGYGHGVGLCQQGAMKMAESGYTYSQILGYYYKGVSLVPLSSIQLGK